MKSYFVLIYFSSSLQDDDAPFAKLFESYGWTAMRWVISIGAICALTSTMMGCIFYLPRVLYAMANDGLMFKFFAKINKKTKTTVSAIVIPGLISGKCLLNHLQPRLGGYYKRKANILDGSLGSARVINQDQKEGASETNAGDDTTNERVLPSRRVTDLPIFILWLY